MKIRCSHICMATLLATSLIATPVLAQEGNPSGTETYDGGYYTIVPPASWMLVSGTLSEKELSQLPSNIREHFIQRNTDVLFLKKDPDKPKAGFISNLNVVIISEEIILSDEVVNEMRPILENQYTQMFKPFNIEVMEKRPFNDKEALYVKGNYTVLNYPVTLEQYLIPSGSTKESLVLSCTYNTETGKEDAEACINAIKTITLK